MLFRSILEVCKAGCDYVDVGMEPLSWGTGHADVLSVQAMLKDAGFKVPEINMSAYMKVRTMIQSFMDDFLGYYIPERNRLMNSLLIAPGLPGGMMGSLMTDLETNLESLNRYKEKQGQPLLSQDELLIKLFDEVTYVWPKVGYPCLVTPFSQYVKNLALMNVVQMEKGKERWSMIADDIWDMILGKSGQLPGAIAPEVNKLAEEQGRKFVTENPQDNYPDALDLYRGKMQEKGWDFGQDDEELFEYAMHPSQYEAFKSGKAKADFTADLEKRKAEKNKVSGVAPDVITVSVNGESYKVNIAYGDVPAQTKTSQSTSAPIVSGDVKEVQAPLEGKFFLSKSTGDTEVKVGDIVKEGDVVCYIEAMKTYNAIRSEFDGKVLEICVRPGDSVFEEDVLIKIG